MIPASTNNSAGPEASRAGAGQQPESAHPGPRPSTPHAYPASKARGAEIILKTRTQRIVFFGGAALALLLVFLLIAL